MTTYEIIRQYGDEDGFIECADCPDDQAEIVKADKIVAGERSPCTFCRYAPPSDDDGKPCTYCPAEGV